MWYNDLLKYYVFDLISSRQQNKKDYKLQNYLNRNYLVNPQWEGTKSKQTLTK